MKGGFINPPNHHILRVNLKSDIDFNEGRVYKPAEPQSLANAQSVFGYFNEGRVYKPAER